MLSSTASTEREILLDMGQTTVKTSLTIPKPLDARLRVRAVKLEVPMSAIVTRALDVYLSSLEQEEEEDKEAQAVLEKGKVKP